MRKMTLTFEVEKQSPASPQPQKNGNAWEKWWLELLKADIPILPDLVCDEENFPKERSGDGGVGCPVGGGAGG